MCARILTRSLRCSLWFSALVGLFGINARGEDFEFFEKKIRPVLIEQCYRCHSEEAAKLKKAKGNLLLDTRAGVRRGGEGGPILDAQRPKESRLLKALRH